MKDASPNCMIRIEIMWNQPQNLYNSQSNHIPLQNFQHGGGRRDRHFPSKFGDFEVWTNVLFYSKLVPIYVCWYCICYTKICFYYVIPYSEYRENNNMVLLKSYDMRQSPRWRSRWWRHLPMSDNIWSSSGENINFLAWTQRIISLVCFANNAIHPWSQVMPIFDREMPPGFTPVICLHRNFVYISNLENRGDKSLDQNF